MRGDDVERPHTRAKLPVRWEPKLLLELRTIAAENTNETTALGYGERPKVDGVDETENGDRRRDAERDRQNRACREARIAAQRGGAIAKIAGEVVDDATASLVTRRLSPLRSAAELDQRRTARLFRRHAAANVSLDRLLEMELKLVIQVFLARALLIKTAEQVCDAAKARQ